MDNKSKSKNLDCEYAYEKVRKNRMSHNFADKCVPKCNLGTSLKPI